MFDDADDTFVKNIYRFAFATIDPRTERGGDDGRNESAPTSTTDAWDGYIYLGGTSGSTSVKTFTGK